MNNKHIKLVGTIFILIISWFSIYIVSNAASFSASISKTTVNVGDTFTVTVKANNAAGMYSVSASNSNVSVSAGNTSEFLENGSATVTYKATKEGKVTITASASDMTDLDDDSKQVTGQKTFNVTVKAKSSGSSSSGSSSSGSSGESSKPQAPSFTTVNETVYATSSVNVRSSYSTSSSIIGSLNEGESVTRIGKSSSWSKVKYNGQTAYISSDYLTTEKPEKSDNKNLKSLSVNGDFELTPKFDKNVTEYNLEVGSDVEKIDIKAVTEDNSAKVTITGNDKLLMGENTVEIKVTAEDGTARAYKINVTKGEIESADLGLGLSELSIDGYTLTPEFSTGTYEYKLDIADSSITSINVNAKSNAENAIIEIAGNNELKVGENIITILVKSEDGKEVTTYQIIVNISENTKKNNQLIAGIDNNDLYMYMGVGLGIIIIVIIIIIIVKRKNKDDNIESYYGGFDSLNKNKFKEEKKVNENNKDKFEGNVDLGITNINNDYNQEPRRNRRSVIEENFGADINYDNFDDDKPKRKKGKHSK